MSYTPDKVTKRVAGKMIMLYGTVGKETSHMASFFHEEKADFVLAAIKASGVKVADESKKGAAKKSAKKATTKKTAKKSTAKKTAKKASKRSKK